MSAKPLNLAKAQPQPAEATSTAVAKLPDSGNFVFTAQEGALAEALGLRLDAPLAIA